MRATTLSELLKTGDRVAVSNITGREAQKVSATSQSFCGNIVGGWALGKGGQTIDIPGGQSIPVFSTAEELFTKLPEEKRPNKVIVYSPPPAVYGDVKGIVEHGDGCVETLFIITEHVSVEVTAKIAQLCAQANIDVMGCNSLGMINVHDGVRVGAVGGNSPADSFRPGSITIISNSGNMVNTMASYLLSAGLGTSFGIATGKDALILLPLKDLLDTTRQDEHTKLIVAYVEPGGLYEADAVQMLADSKYPVPIIAYVTGEILEKFDLSLGHAGAVVGGGKTSAAAKMKLFDEYFGVEPFEPGRKYKKTPELAAALKRGIRIRTLHHLPAAAALTFNVLGIERDFQPTKPLRLNPWFVDYKKLGKSLPRKLIRARGTIPEPYASQVKVLSRETLGANPPRRDMRNASHASSNDGRTTRIHGHSLEKVMEEGSFAEAMLLAWTGERARPFEVELLQRCLVASITNGPGTISAQAAKLSTSAGNAPNTAMIATLACIGDVHGGNGRRAVEYLLGIFSKVNLADPHASDHGLDLQMLVDKEADRFNRQRNAAKAAGTDYARIPCLGHPVFKNDPVNYDPRERVIANYLSQNGLSNIFLEFYHGLAHRLKEIGVARNVWAVNLDGAIASVVLGICWEALKEKRITVRRACDIAFSVFAIGRAAGGVAEFLDHQDHGSPMDMRIPVSECITLSRPTD